jgi:succinyl-CoA synthetase beta subunit
MYLLESQSKKIIKKFGLPIPVGTLVGDSKIAHQFVQEMNSRVVLKAQVPVNKRFEKGGILFAETPEDATAFADQLLGSVIDSNPVGELLIEQAVSYIREVYVAIAISRSDRTPILLYSPIAGRDIESKVLNNLTNLHSFPLDIREGIIRESVEDWLRSVREENGVIRNLIRVYEKLFKAFQEYCAELIELNPLGILEDNSCIALDARIAIDNNSIDLLPERLNDPELCTPLEVEAKHIGIPFVQLDGDVGVLSNGAGLGMATIDFVADSGARPANFIDLGGQGYKKSEAGLELVLSNDAVNCLLINLFGAFAQTDVMAEGICSVLSRLNRNIPISARVKGSGSSRALELFKQYGVDTYDSLSDAVAGLFHRK